MAFQGISVGIGAEVADFQSGMRAVRDSMGRTTRQATETGASLGWMGEQADETSADAAQLMLAMYGLADASDEAGDDLFGATAAAGTTSGAFNTLSLSAGNATFSVGSFSSVLTLSLIPAVITLSTVLAPLVATLGVMAGALGGVVAGFGAVIGMGAIGHVKELRAAFDEAVGKLMPFVKIVGQQFTPLLFDAVEAIAPLGFRILEAMGPLDEFADTLRSFGGLAMDAIPAVVGGLLDLGRMALPVLEDVVRFLLNRGPQAFNAMVRVTQELAPHLRDIAGAFIDILPSLLEFGTNVANTILPVIPPLIRGFGDVMGFANGLSDRFQQLAIGGSLLAPVLIGLVSVLGGPLTLAVAGVAAAIAGLSMAWEQNLFGIRDATADAVGRLEAIFGRLGPLFTAVEGIMNNLRVAWGMVGDDVLTIGSALLDGLLGVFTTLVDAVVSMVTVIAQILNGDFQGALETAMGFWKRTFSGIIDWVRTWGDRLVAAVLNVVADAIAGGATHLENFLSQLGVNIDLGASGIVSDIRAKADTYEARAARNTVPDAARDSSQQDQRVVLELKDEMLEARIEDGAGRVVQGERDEARYLNGGPR